MLLKPKKTNKILRDVHYYTVIFNEKIEFWLLNNIIMITKRNN